MTKPDLVIRTNRRSLSISISKTGQLVVKAPRKLSMEYILDFIKEKEKWINKKKKEITDNISNNKKIIEYNSFLIFGKAYKKVAQAGLKEIEVTNNQMVFPLGKDINETFKYAQNFYIGLSKDILKSRVEYFADLMQLNYNKVVIMDNKRRWGACTSNATLKFNYRLCMLPHKVIDYIIIHELSHLLEFNHSPRFYKVVESIMPDYKKYRNQLKTYDYVLTLLR